MGRSRGILEGFASHLAADSDQERDEARLRVAGHGTPLIASHPHRALAIAAVLAAYASAALAASTSTRWSVAAAAAMLLAEPTLWAISGLRVPKAGIAGMVLRWLPSAVRLMAMLCVVIATGWPAPPSTLLLLLPPIALLPLSRDASPIAAVPMAVVAAAAAPASPAAWSAVAAAVSAGCLGAVFSPALDKEARSGLIARLALMEERVAALRSAGTVALRDPLTGVLNRRGLQDEANRLFNYVRIRGGKMGVMMLDIDHFKRINDTYGHNRGDEALRTFANVLSSATRPRADVVARFGGEEFVIITDDIGGMDDLAAFAERLRLLVARTSWGQDSEGKPLGFTCSIGLAVWPDSGENDVGRLLDMSDKALYASKESGRNRVVGHLGTGPGGEPRFLPVMQERSP